MDDVVSLLHTNDGHYAAACALDFANPPKYYDTFALRDDEGHEPVMQTWPYFRSWRSRKALTSNQPVPVRSCWNGMGKSDCGPILRVLILGPSKIFGVGPGISSWITRL